MKPRVGILVILAAVVLAVLPFRAAADHCPCGDLLLPYFELGLPATAEDDVFMMRTATLAVGNCGSSEEPVFLHVWTNWGVSVLRVAVTIPEHGVFTANLRDWLLFGRLPDRTLDAADLAHVQAALAGERSPKTGLYYATPTGGKMAGYLTAALGSRGRDVHVLWGDFFAIDPVEEDAAGESLVRMVDDDTREVCRRHLVRFLEGGAFDGHTRFLVWTGVRGAPSAEPQPSFPLPSVACRAYDESGRLLETFRRSLLATQALPAAELGLTEPFGWLDCTTDTLAFIGTQHEARYRFDVALRSFCMAQLGPGPGPGPDEVGVSLEKSTNGEDADLPPGPVLPVGSAVSWEYVVTNTGAVALLDLVVADDPPADVVCPTTSLAPGESMTCTATGTAAAGQYHNLAAVTGHSESGVDAEASDVSHYFGREEEPPVAAISLEKLTNGEDADLPPGPPVLVESPVSWMYVVTNTGEVTLLGVAVVDDPPVAVTCPKTTLAPGESMTCTATGTAILGQFANLATASGHPAASPAVSDSDPSHYYGEEPPPPPGDQGCTPGYWKNHTASWPAAGYSPAQLVSSVFPSAAAWPGLASSTLLQALGFDGGAGAEGAAEILLRAGVAALLNAAHPDVGYPRSEASVLSDVDAALANGSRDGMLLLAAQLDADNNLGCPLS